MLPTRARGASGGGVRAEGALFDTGRLIDEVVTGLGIDWYDLERIALHEHISVRADHTVESHRIRETMRATRDGVDRFVAFYGRKPGAAAAA